MVDVTLNRGRLVIRDGGRLVLETGNGYLDADADGKTIVVVTAEGRVQQLRADGRFERDIANGATRARIVGDLIRVTRKDDRIEEYRGGRMMRSYKP
jgi:hypothetical protein